MTSTALPKPQTHLPIPVISDLQRRLQIFSGLQDRRDSRGAAAFWSCSSWQRGHHIDSLPMQKTDEAIAILKSSGEQP